MRNLTKRYGAVTALDAISLTVGQGEIYGFLGPNGAGKTTTIRTLLGFVRPTAGTSALFGHDCWRDGVAARRELGFLTTADTLYPDMSGASLLDYAATLSRRPPTLRPHLLEALELSAAALARPIRGYSKGMKQKLALTACMQTNSRLLILDEPTDGLDPLMQRAFDDVIIELRQQGTTIFMSSHDLAEVERLCQRVAIIRAGKIVAEAAISELTARQQRMVEVQFAGAAPSDLTAPGVSVTQRDDTTLHLTVRGNLHPLLHALAARGDVADVLISRPTLEQVFHEFYAPSEPAGPTR
ncbi:MAG: ATP-binding cassette domain-containing protein [Thermomicrobiales bacterium]